jgi:hypothetical protein
MVALTTIIVKDESSFFCGIREVVRDRHITDLNSFEPLNRTGLTVDAGEMPTFTF